SGSITRARTIGDGPFRWEQRGLELRSLDVGTLEPDRARPALPDQVATAQEVSAVGTLEEQLGVGRRCDPEAHSRGEIASQESCDDRCVGALSGEDEVDTRGSAFRPEALEQAF